MIKPLIIAAVYNNIMHDEIFMKRHLIDSYNQAKFVIFFISAVDSWISNIRFVANKLLVLLRCVFCLAKMLRFFHTVPFNLLQNLLLKMN